MGHLHTLAASSRRERSPGTRGIEDRSPALVWTLWGDISSSVGNQSLDYPAHSLVIVHITLSLLLTTLPLAECNLVLHCLISCDLIPFPPLG